MSWIGILNALDDTKPTRMVAFDPARQTTAEDRARRTGSTDVYTAELS